MEKWISVDKAVIDLLREYDLSLNDLLTVMKSEDIDVYVELIKRIHNCTREALEYIYSLPWKTVALLLFTIQSLYIINSSGLYKGYKIHPPRETVVVSNKVSFNGLLQVLIHLRDLT